MLALSRNIWTGALGLAMSSLLVPQASAQTFIPTSGVHAWNDDNNWSPPPFPDGSGLSATLPVPTADLTVNLGQTITNASQIR